MGLKHTKSQDGSPSTTIEQLCARARSMIQGAEAMKRQAIAMNRDAIAMNHEALASERTLFR